jgi:hypothetical protein
MTNDEKNPNARSLKHSRPDVLGKIIFAGATKLGFELGILNFFRHSSFGFRHFS